MKKRGLFKKQPTKAAISMDSEEITNDSVKWNSYLTIIYAFLIFFIGQIIGLLLLFYPLIFKHYSYQQSLNWLSNSIYSQFFYVLIIETVTVYLIIFTVRKFKTRLSAIGLVRPRWKDLAYGLAGLTLYYPAYIVLILIIQKIDPSLNINQKQNIGFSGVSGNIPILLTFFSLVILPPIAEESLFRGFLYSGLRKKMPKIIAALLTSAIFASAHLPEGVGGLLWAGGIDVFILSMVLVFLREKTNSIWPGVTLHAIKNGIAFYLIYISPLIMFH